MNAPAVRRLTAPDAAALRQLRLNALVETPESFGSSYEEEHTLTLADIRAWISPADDGAMYGVFLGDTLAGIVGVSRQRKLKLRHKAHIADKGSAGCSCARRSTTRQPCAASGRCS